MAKREVTGQELADKLLDFFDGDSKFEEKVIREVILDVLDYMEAE